MNGVHPADGNRFWELGLVGKSKSSKHKRPRPDDFLPLPAVTQDERNIPRYLVATATSISKEETIRPLASYNVFQVEKGLKYISADYLEVNEMRSGDLLIKVPNSKTADKFLKANFIDNIQVKITLHRALNTTQGRIYSRKIINITEEELLLALKDQKVVEIHKILKKDGDRMVATGAAIVTFDLIRRPEKLKIGWEIVKVDEHIPNPMRCLNCQRLGHTKKRCKNVELCRDCGLTPPHEQCIRKYCVNCHTEDHTSYDSSCPTFWKHKSVNYLKITRRCTIREAWTIFNDNPTVNTLQPMQKKKKTFAQIVSNGSLEETTPTNKNILSKESLITKQTESTVPTNTLQRLNTSTIQSSQKANKTQKPTKENNDKEINLQYENQSTSIHKNNLSLNSSNESINLTSYPSSFTQHGTYTNSSLDNISSLKSYARNSTYKAVNTKSDDNLNDILMDHNNDSTGFSTPTREISPCSQLYNKFPELSTIITPKTFKETLPKKTIKEN